MEKLQLEGTIEKIMETQTFDSGFQKREFIVNTGGDYPQKVKFEVTKDKCFTASCTKWFNCNKVGDVVNVSFNIRGSEYTKNERTMYFVTLAAWRVDKVEVDKHLQTEQLTNTVAGEVNDDLPF